MGELTQIHPMRKDKFCVIRTVLKVGKRLPPQERIPSTGPGSDSFQSFPFDLCPLKA